MGRMISCLALFSYEWEPPNYALKLFYIISQRWWSIRSSAWESEALCSGVSQDFWLTT